MGLLDEIHGKHVFRRRVRVLSRMFAELLPANASVLDVGCGEGSIDSLIMALRPDITIRGTDRLVRSHTQIPVDLLDSKTLPYGDESIDVVLLVDVLHHSQDPIGLLSEVARVTRRQNPAEGPHMRRALGSSCPEDNGLGRECSARRAAAFELLVTAAMGGRIHQALPRPRSVS